MKEFRETIVFSKKTADYIQNLLDMREVDMHEMKMPRDACLEVYDVVFEDGCSVDLKVCSGSEDFFIDPVLFDADGCEIGLLDVTDEILGEYVFEKDDRVYVVNAVLEDE